LMRQSDAPMPRPAEITSPRRTEAAMKWHTAITKSIPLLLGIGLSLSACAVAPDYGPVAYGSYGGLDYGGWDGGFYGHFDHDRFHEHGFAGHGGDVGHASFGGHGFAGHGGGLGGFGGHGSGGHGGGGHGRG
jgi:hypothetical protein